MTVPNGFRIERGLLWPDTDIRAAQVLFNHAADLETVYGHCRAFDVVVQAGGNCGIWPRDLSRKFGTVYTFEPDQKNFRCLCTNAPEENIFKFNAALGNLHTPVGLHQCPENVGAHYIEGPGPIPTLRIDDLGLRGCDLICLDIEGYELRALDGAKNTIEAFRPTIVVEDKGCSEKYGSLKGDVEDWLRILFGYRVVERISRDVVLVP